VIPPAPDTSPAERHAAMRNQPVATWPVLRRWSERLQGASRPRFLSSVLVIGALALAIAWVGEQLLVWLWSAR
jgi:hypothetical protein